MSTNPAELPFLTSMGLMLSYRCPVACPHCVVEAGPRRTEVMPIDQCLRWIDSARSYRGGRIKGLALTGGEPFLDLDHLRLVSAHARKRGFIVSVVTNAYWASSKEEAYRVLSMLPDIHLMSISTDIYHQRTIPLDFVINAILAARALQRIYNIAICTVDEAEESFQRTLHDLREMGEANSIRVSITSPVGRALRTMQRKQLRRVPEPTISACSMASSPIIFPDGRVIGCIGPVLALASHHPIVLGNLNQDPMDKVFERAEDNVLLHLIRIWGPHRLVTLLKERGLSQWLPQDYIQNCVCDICYQLFSDARLVDGLMDLQHDDDLRQMVAFARLHYLDEPQMLHQCKGRNLMGASAQ